MSERSCHRAAALELAELIAEPADSPVVAELQTHADQCAECARLVQQAAALRIQFSALRSQTAAKVAQVDLGARALGALARAGDVRRTALRRGAMVWWVGFGLAAATAVAVLVWRRAAEPVFVAVSSSSPAIAVVDGTARSVQGRRVALPVPMQLSAPADADATVHAAGTVRLWPRARISIRDRAHFDDLLGRASVQCGEELVFATPVATITARGALELETRQQGAPMTLTRKQTVVGGSAVVVAAVVTAGWIHISSGTGAGSGSGGQRIEGPATVVVDRTGAVTRLPPDGLPILASATAPTPGGEPGADQAASGAYWDEQGQRIAFALAGEVFDASSGAQVTGFDVEARRLESKGFGGASQIERSFSERADGSFALDQLGLGLWQVTVRAADYAPSSQPVDLSALDANPLLQFPLTEGAQVTGVVVDWLHRPVADAKVGQPDCFRRSDPKCPLATTDGEGRFVLPAVPEEQVFALRAEHRRYGFSEIKNLRQEPGETRHVRIELSGVLRAHGRVSRGPDAAPVAGAQLRSGDGVVAVSDAGGDYEMLIPLAERPTVVVTRDPARPAARVEIESYPESRSAWDIRWVEAETHVAEVEIDFRLQMESAAIHGLVTDDRGAPIGGARLSFSNTAGWKRGRGHETFPTSAVTDETGRYRVDDVPGEAGYRVALIDEDGRHTPLGYVSVPGEVEVEANFALGSGAVRGTFVDEQGEPFAVGARECHQLGARSQANVYAVADCLGEGRFEFVRLPPGHYRLENRRPWPGSPIEIRATELDVAPGAVVDGVEVVVTGEEARNWRLRVLDERGRFVAGAYFRYHIGATSSTSNLDVGDDGVAEIDLAEGVHTIFIDAPGFQPEQIDLAERDPGAIITVHLRRR